jgi:hypothetical protein
MPFQGITSGEGGTVGGKARQQGARFKQVLSAIIGIGLAEKRQIWLN